MTLVAVSKTQPAERVEQAYDAGQRVFGENQLQEALQKIDLLAGLGIEWHFIGPVQSNKTRAIAEHFDWVQSVDRGKIAQRLSAARPQRLPPLNVCIQVNPGAEATKHGVSIAQAPALASEVASLPQLRLRGLMTIPEHEAGLALRRFQEVKALFDHMNGLGYRMDTLSMGMSEDFETAIAAGSTMVRIGTALFGARAVPRTQEH